VIDGFGEVLQHPGRDGYRARHAQPSPALVGASAIGASAIGASAIGASAIGASAVGASHEWVAEGPIEDTVEGPQDFRFAVRPYTWTRGRTWPVADLALETLVSTSEQGRDASAICSAEHAAIAQLCFDVRSVAEVAALLALPLGVVRVLLADMVDTGLMHVHRNLMGWGSAPSLAMMERVLAGLQQL
jgi:hypothetical protein